MNEGFDAWDKFCVLILSYRRARRQLTLKSLAKFGYSGPVFILVSDDDEELPLYRKLYGDKVVVFAREAYRELVDAGDADPSLSGVVYARCAAFDVVRRLGYVWFLMLDDDYNYWEFRFDHEMRYVSIPAYGLDACFAAYLRFYASSPLTSLALAQGGDFVGGASSRMWKRWWDSRKVMNCFFCCVDRRFMFFGRLNEDVNTYCLLGEQGYIFLTLPLLTVHQGKTQNHPGGLTDLYLDKGTYVKRFYAVMYCPSAVFLGVMGNKDFRPHHTVDWQYAVPKIVSERFRVES